jgi:hypothetical protein
VDFRRANLRGITGTTFAIALLAFSGHTALAGVLTFDDAYASLGNGGNPATYYSPEGVTISGTNSGVIGGIGNGDPGNWLLEGTNGSAFLGCNRGNACSPTFDFSSAVDGVSLDIGLSNDFSASFTVSGYLDDSLVDSDTLVVTDTGTDGGTWDTFSLSGAVDEVVISSSFSGGFFYGLDNVNFDSATPEPASFSMLLLGVIGLGMGAYRRRLN